MPVVQNNNFTLDTLAMRAERLSAIQKNQEIGRFYEALKQKPICFYKQVAATLLWELIFWN